MNNFVDVCLFSIVNKKLSVLLIKRGFEPYKDMWALPGCKYQEALTCDENALYVLDKELELKNIYLNQLKTYAGLNRDPRGSSLSICYLSLLDYRKVNLVKTKDAVDFKWVPIENLFKEEIAFDHKDMIKDAVERIKNQLQYSKIGFTLVGEIFSLSEVVEIFQEILNVKIDVSNLRKKLLSLELIKEVAKQNIGRGRPETVYSLNKDAFNLLENGQCFFNK